MRETVRFLMGGEVREIERPDPTMTVLEYLRGPACRPGTKEGCAEGDCGACTVVLGELDGGGDGAGPAVRYRAVNACIQFVPVLDGKELITVEDLSETDPATGVVDLHPVQQALATAHASQCGFCTPGFVMSLYGAFADNHGGSDRGGAPLSREDIKTVLAGNLCRCTGYGPIVDGALAAQDALNGSAGTARGTAGGSENGAKAAPDRQTASGAGATTDEAQMGTRGACAALTALATLDDGETLGFQRGEGDNARRFYAPRTIDALTGLLARHPGAHIIAGLTDVGLWVTKMHRRLDTLISIGRIDELKAIAVDAPGRPGWIDIGAGATLTAVQAPLGAAYPALDELIRRFASVQIRNVATVGGNIANGSPIGDLAPALIAAGARLVLRGPEGAREIDLEDFFIEYGRQDRGPSEFVERVLVPLPDEGVHYACWKISKRFEQDISAVCAAFSVAFDGTAREGATVTAARFAFGGMAGVPKRASGAEAALVGRQWTEDTVRSAMAALDGDFTALDDMRGSARYRAASARNLVLKFYLQTIDSKSVSGFEIARGEEVVSA